MKRSILAGEEIICTKCNKTFILKETLSSRACVHCPLCGEYTNIHEDAHINSGSGMLAGAIITLIIGLVVWPLLIVSAALFIGYAITKGK